MMNFKLSKEQYFVRQMVKAFGNESAAEKVERSVADMAVPRARKKKKSDVHKPPKDQKERWDLIKTANYVVISALVRTLWTEYGWRHKRIADFLEAILSLLDESRRFGYERLIKDTYDLTGVDVKKLVDEIYG